VRSSTGPVAGLALSASQSNIHAEMQSMKFKEIQYSGTYMQWALLYLLLGDVE
jgi:hypothetical protein